MSFAYEKLSDDHFQLVVQSLLTSELPGVQCLPVNMPDGGRDALQRDSQSRAVHIFQVKMARKPHEIKDVVEWITSAIVKEMPKIERLVERGCSHYRLITNIPGSSHLGSGVVDRVQSFLDTLNVAADCWWQNDLDRRLENNFNLRLRYPALLDGADLPRLLLEYGSNAENDTRRREALEAYFKDQYIKDRYIRFKQIELDDAELFDLFIDVPIIPLRPAGRAGAELHREYSMAVERSACQQAWRYREAGRPSAIVGVATNPRSGFEEDTDEDELVDAPFHRGYVSIGAALLLVEPEFRPPGAGIIIEGAPGQGKSTLSQFLVQIQRARLLDDRSVMSKVPPHHLDSPAQIPFKLELRDLAVWMRGLDPWDNDQERAHGRAKSLEGALAAHVERFSGGVEFSVTDLRNVIRGRPTLVVLDALDEVADLQDRAMVIEEVTSAIGRLASAEQNSSAEQNLRVLITSRPTAISNAPTFSHSKFCYLRLDSISPSEALRYTSLWAKARRLQAKAELDLRRILGQRLNTPHMADLARNTMQLSILLSLIHVRGASLPDKRTELYDEYINLFLNREAEKSLIVRDKRELIVAIYQYLGYYLHARAESGRSNGRIAEAELRRVVRDYLEDQGESTELVDDLFTGLAERVFALVSRMQGTYEFEVQPIREYFAARYLYNTAPYSPTGREARGTKPDRFEGISQNPYWLNVTRFFAGCFSKGELCDLAERVCELIRNPEFELAAYPRVMAISLLQDWVFSQSRRATDEVAAAVSDDHGLRWIGNSLLLPFWRSYSYDAVLPPSTGGQRLAQAAWKKLVSVTQIECIDDLARVIVFHTTPQERHALLESVLRREANVTIPSLSLALMFEILDDIEPETVSWELAQIPESKRGSVLVDCVRARVNFASFNEADVAAATQAILGARPHVHNYHGEPGPLTEMGVFWQLTNPSFWLQGSYRSSYLLQQLESQKNREISTTEAFARVFEWNRYALSLVGGDFHTGLGLWRMLIDRLESDFGESWSSIDLAAASAGIRSSRERGAGAASLFDPGANMADRFRFARRRGSQLEWWRQQLSAISDFRDARAYALAVNVWATPDVQQVLLEDVDGILRELDEVDQLNVVSATRFAGRTYSTIARRKWLKGDWVSQLDELSSSTKALLLNKSEAADRLEIIRSCAKDSELNYFAATLCLESLVAPLLEGVVTETESAALVGRFHEAGASSLTVIEKFLTGRKRKALNSLTPDEILRNPWRWPNVFVLWAQEARDGQLARPRPVKSTAERERWFGA